MVTENMQEQITLSEAAKRLRLTYLTLWKWSKAGKLDGLEKRDGRLFVPVKTVDALLAEREEVRHA